jgi:hypothetical protein
MYELEAHETLVPPEYLARLNAPKPWSAKLVPYHANMVRCQSKVLHSPEALADSEFDATALNAAGAAQTVTTVMHILSLTMVPGDIA